MTSRFAGSHAPRPASATFDIAEVVRQLMLSHGTEATLDNGAIRFANSGHLMAPVVVREWHPRIDTVTVQLDVRLRLESGERIVESFIGIGPTNQEAARDALNNFASCSLHVFLAAFFGSPAGQGVELETWEISGLRYQAFIGGMAVRGTYPLEGPAGVDWFRHVVREASRQELARQVHWIRFFYSQHPGHPATAEALLDNDEWAPLQESLARFDWPKSSGYYSVRVFLVLKPAVDSTAS